MILVSSYQIVSLFLHSTNFFKMILNYNTVLSFSVSFCCCCYLWTLYLPCSLLMDIWIECLSHIINSLKHYTYCIESFFISGDTQLWICHIEPQLPPFPWTFHNYVILWTESFSFFILYSTYIFVLFLKFQIIPSSIPVGLSSLIINLLFYDQL